MSDKPVMTKKAASLHVTRAAIDARQKAKQRGGDDSIAEALMSVGETLTVGPLTLQPYSLKTSWALQKVGSKYMESQARPAEAFAPLDADGDGKITLDDLRSGTRLPEDTLVKWFPLVDQDKDGCITLAEFVAARGLPRQVEPQDIVIAALCFAEPWETFQAAAAGGLTEITRRAFDVAGELSMEDLASINQFMELQFSLYMQGREAEEATPGKSPRRPPARNPTTTAAVPAEP